MSKENMLGEGRQEAAYGHTIEPEERQIVGKLGLALEAAQKELRQRGLFSVLGLRTELAVSTPSDEELLQQACRDAEVPSNLYISESNADQVRRLYRQKKAALGSATGNDAEN